MSSKLQKSKLQKFKKWAKENLAGLITAVIAVAGIITTVVVGARKAVLQGTQATSKFAKAAVANRAKKYGLYFTYFKHHQHVAIVGCEGDGMVEPKSLGTVRGRSRATLQRN